MARDDYLKIIADAVDGPTIQQIPNHQALKKQELLKEMTIHLHEVVDGSLRGKFAFFSHKWDGKGYPFDSKGKKLRQMRCALLADPAIQFVFVDWIALPQGVRTPEETQYFRDTLEVMLPNLVLGASVIVIWDPDFNRRFWPSIEVWIIGK